MNKFEYDGSIFSNQEELIKGILETEEELAIDIDKKRDIDKLILILKRNGILVRKCSDDGEELKSPLLVSINGSPDKYLEEWGEYADKKSADKNIMSFAEAMWCCGVAALKSLETSQVCLKRFSDLKKLVNSLDDLLKQKEKFEEACRISIGWMTAKRCYRFGHGADTLDGSEIDLYYTEIEEFNKTIVSLDKKTVNEALEKLRKAKELKLQKIQQKTFMGKKLAVADDSKIKETLSDPSSEETTVQMADTSCRSQASKLIENIRLQMKKNELDSQTMKAKLREIYEVCSSDEDLEILYSIDEFLKKTRETFTKRNGDSDLDKLKNTLWKELKKKRHSVMKKYIMGYNKWDNSLDNLGTDEWKELSRLCADSFKYARLLELNRNSKRKTNNVVVRFYNITRHFSLKCGNDEEFVWNKLNEDESIPFYSNILAKKELYMGKLTLEELIDMDQFKVNSFYAAPWLELEKRHGGDTLRKPFEKAEDPEKLSKTLYQNATRPLKTEMGDLEVKFKTLATRDSDPIRRDVRIKKKSK